MSEKHYDVFLCHSSKDKSEVRRIGEQLVERGIRPWLDEWELRPGLPWQSRLESQIEQIDAAAVFVGKSGFGPWQDLEIAAFLRRFASRKCPVIPVLLPDLDVQPELPAFLEGMTWVDFRKSDPDPLDQLIWGITGEKEKSAKILTRATEEPRRSLQYEHAMLAAVGVSTPIFAERIDT